MTDPQSVQSLVTVALPAALALAPQRAAAQRAIDGTTAAFQAVARATVQADRQQITPLQAQAVAMDGWTTLGRVRSFLIETGLMEFGAVASVFRLIVDGLAYAIKALTTSVAEAMRLLFGGTPGDYAKWLLGGLLVLGLGWIYVTGFTAGGQSLLMSIGRGNLAMGRGLGIGYAAVGKATATHAIPAVVKLIPSTVGIV